MCNKQTFRKETLRHPACLFKVVALETANHGVTCNAICPGWVLTPLIQAQIDKIAVEKGISNEEAGKSLLVEKQALHQFALPSEIGDLVLFLCSQSAKSITGTALEVSGGWTAQ